MSNPKLSHELDEKAIEEVVKELANSPMTKMSEDFDLHNADFEKTESTVSRVEEEVRKLPNVRLVTVGCPRTAVGGFGVIRDLIYYGPREELEGNKSVDLGRMSREWLNNEGLTNFSVNNIEGPIPLNAQEVAKEREKNANFKPSTLFKVRVTMINPNL